MAEVRPEERKAMFTELMPCLQETIVTLTISRIDEQLLRVNVIPKRKTDKESTAENALCTPLTVTATAAELDQDLGRQVVSFSHSYQRSAANIREIEEAHAAAVKAAEEERKARKPAVPPAKTSPRSDNDSKAAPAGKPVFGSKGNAAAPAPATQSLFDTPAGEAKGAKDESTGVATVVGQSEPESGASAADGEPPAQPKSAITSPVPSAPGAVENGSASHPVEETICDICKYPILPTQERHPFMPVPAHASAMDCGSARRQVGGNM
jgi:PRTRC genetic system protein E